MINKKMQLEEIRKRLIKINNDAIDRSRLEGRLEQINDEIEFLNDNFVGQNIFVWTKDAVLKRMAILDERRKELYRQMERIKISQLKDKNGKENNNSR